MSDHPATRIIRAIEADGFEVESEKTYGSALATIYTMTCGCQRVYSLVPGFGPPKEEETLPVACDQHKHLETHT